MCSPQTGAIFTVGRADNPCHNTTVPGPDRNADTCARIFSPASSASCRSCNSLEFDDAALGSQTRTLGCLFFVDRVQTDSRDACKKLAVLSPMPKCPSSAALREVRGPPAAIAIAVCNSASVMPLPSSATLTYEARAVPMNVEVDRASAGIDAVVNQVRNG